MVEITPIIHQFARSKPVLAVKFLVLPIFATVCSVCLITKVHSAEESIQGNLATQRAKFIANITESYSDCLKHFGSF